MWGNSRICLWVSSGLSWHSLLPQSRRTIGPQEAGRAVWSQGCFRAAGREGWGCFLWMGHLHRKKANLFVFFITFSIAQVAAEQTFLNFVIAVTMLSGNYCLQMRPESAPYTGVILRGRRRRELSVAFLGWAGVCWGWGTDFMLLRFTPGRDGTESSSSSLCPAIWRRPSNKGHETCAIEERQIQARGWL